MKQPHLLIYIEGQEYAKPIKLTGKVKKVKSAGARNAKVFYQEQHYILGIPVWRTWIPEHLVVFMEPKTVEYTTLENIK